MRDSLDGNITGRFGYDGKPIGRAGGKASGEGSGTNGVGGVLSLKAALQHHLVGCGRSAGGGIGCAAGGGWAKSAQAPPAAATGATNASINVSKLVVILDAQCTSVLPLYSFVR
jgi:hypothetical protein